MAPARTVAVLAAFAVASVSPAIAAERGGFFGGVSIGLGGSGCHPCETVAGPTIGGHAGWLTESRVAPVVEFMAHTYVDGSANSSGGVATYAAGVQYWPARPIWLAAQVGVGEDVHRTLGDRALALVGQVGFELRGGQGFGLEIRGRYELLTTDDPGHTVSVGVGFSWY